MKQFKNLVALVLAMLLIVGTMGMALADDKTTVTITSNITGETGSVYSGWKILNAIPANTTPETYTYSINTKYASVLSTLTGATTDKGVYDYIAALTTASAIQQFADDLYNAVKNMDADATLNEATGADVAYGYWLFAETTEGTVDGGPSTSKVMADTAGKAALPITTKESIPTVDKSITGVNETDMNTDDAAVKVDDIVEFTLDATLSNHLHTFKNEETGAYNYYFAFNDEMSDGLEFVAISSVTVDGTNNSAYTTDATAGCQEFKVEWTNLVNGLNETQVRALEGKHVVVVYTARVTDDAVITSAGNPNEVTIEFSRNPYNTDHGESLPSESRVYTFTLDIFKVKQGTSGQEALNGAGFTLYYKAAADGTYAAVGSELQHDDSNEFKWERLAPGYYKLVETTVPSGYNKMDDIEFQVTEAFANDARTTLNCTYDGFTATNATGIITGNILNQAGTELPSTGGIGTTIIYIVGAVLVLGAAAVILARRKAEQN